MEKRWHKGFHLDLDSAVMTQLRLAAQRHDRSVVTEATRLLEETLLPKHGGDKTCEKAAAEPYRANGLYLDLSEELVARLKPLADGDYRSIAGEAAFVLQKVLRLTAGERRSATACARMVKPRKKRGRPPKPK